jgi:very-short-patch-repair endonuclease
MTPSTAAKTGDLNLHGHSPRTIQRLADDGAVTRVHRGIYLPSPSTDRVALWHQHLDAHLARGGPLAALSHRTAAILHAFEGFDADALERPEDITVPLSSAWRKAPALRTTLDTERDVIDVDGRAVTTPVRTLIDLGRFVDADVIEIALEALLRIPNGPSPEHWNEALLDMLTAQADASRQYGSLIIRSVLRRRHPGPPTGSIAETVIVQALRRQGVVLDRQVRIELPNGRRGVRVVYPDFATADRRILVEIDGRRWHSGNRIVDLDDRRQNQLTASFRVLRFRGGRALAEPDAVAAEIIATL